METDLGLYISNKADFSESAKSKQIVLSQDIDADQGGIIKREESTAAYASLFERWDSHFDGLLDKREIWQVK
ncbi:MAG: hypothetical protein ABGY95_10635 [Rubritalea sp.]